MFNGKFVPTIQIIDWSSSKNTLCVFSFQSLRKKMWLERTSVIHSAAPHVPLFCSCHILTSSVIYYWTDTRKHGIYLLLCYPYFELQDHGLIFSEHFTFSFKQLQQMVVESFISNGIPAVGISVGICLS